jgi:hypothetical protein
LCEREREKGSKKVREKIERAGDKERMLEREKERGQET